MRNKRRRVCGLSDLEAHDCVRTGRQKLEISACEHWKVTPLNAITSTMNATHRKTLAAIFANPVRSDVRWDAIEALFLACGADISEGRGSRVRVLLNGAEAVFHRPHPKPETDKGALKSVRRFLSEAGIEP